jgi:hypothetical protein
MDVQPVRISHLSVIRFRLKPWVKSADSIPYTFREVHRIAFRVTAVTIDTLRTFKALALIFGPSTQFHSCSLISKEEDSARLWEQLREYFEVHFRAEKYGVQYFLAESEAKRSKATHGKRPQEQERGKRSRI